MKKHIATFLAGLAAGAGGSEAVEPMATPYARRHSAEFQVGQEHVYADEIDLFLSEGFGAKELTGALSLQRPDTASVCWMADGANIQVQVPKSAHFCKLLDQMVSVLLCADGACKPEQLIGALRLSRPDTPSVRWHLVGEFALPGEWVPE